MGDASGKAEEAINFYVSVFQQALVKRGESGVREITRYAKGAEPEREGTVAFATFMLDGQEFAAMDGAREHGFAFNEAISLMVSGETQREIDYYWERLSAVPEAEQCGWLKDNYGVSWQIVPTAMDEMMSRATPEQLARLTAAFLPMKRLDIAALEKAYRA